MLVRRRRDLGAGVLSQRSGKDRAGAGGSSILGLAWRLQRATLAGWCLGAATLGAVAGGLAPVVRDALTGNPPLQELIGRLVPGSQSNVIDIFVTALLGMAGVLAAAAGIQAVLRLRTEEVEGRAELLLAVPLSRTPWLATNLAIAAASVVAVTSAAGIATAIGLRFSASGTDGVALIAAALAHAPAAAVFPMVTSLVFATVPRLSSGLGWGFLIAGLILGQFGELLGLPVWAQEISPFRHSSAMPVEPFDPGGALVLCLVALAGAGLAAYLVRRRDLAA